MKKHPIQLILSPNFVFTDDLTELVFAHLEDLNDEGAMDVYHYLLALPSEALKQKVKIAIQIFQDEELLFNIAQLLKRRQITFKDLSLSPPQKLIRLLKQIGDYEDYQFVLYGNQV